LGLSKDDVERGIGVAEQTSSDNSENDATSAGVGTPNLAVDGELVAAADRLLASVVGMKPRPRRNRPLAIATFAAYEAKREIAPKESAPIIWLYRIFLTVTFTSPFIVIASPKELHSVVWDGVGLLSTMFLLYLTYGVYTFKMLGRAFSAMKQLISDPGSWTSEGANTALADLDQGEGDGREAVLAVGLLIAGSIAFVFALLALYELGQAAQQIHTHATAHLEELLRVARNLQAQSGNAKELEGVALLANDRAIYAATYCWYFFFIWLLAGLFIFMDFSVAAFNTSHSESYIAASSAAFVTLPMFAGVSLVGTYLIVEYVSAWNGGAKWPFTMLSVEFASGALTFQMMLSNIIFVIMKKNLVFRLFYNAVETSRKP
jgi:hypothetical protein